MARTVGIGIQNFEEIRENNYFYIDKTSFIKEWWESGDSVTLIVRPRRFGKTLNMSMLERFFSCEFAGENTIFKNLTIWNEKKYRELQGTYPVINLTFAFIKETDYESTCNRMLEVLMEQFKKYAFVADSGKLSQNDKDYMRKMSFDMTPFEAGTCLRRLSECLYHYYDKKIESNLVNSQEVF